VVLLALLLVLFVYTVVVARPEDDVPAEASAPESLAVIPVARTPPAPARHCRPGDHRPPCPPLVRPASTGYTARHTPAAVPVISPPKVSAGPPRQPMSARALVIAGLAIAVIGGWLLLRTGQGATACAHRAAAICSEGFVVLTATQVLGSAIILAGLALFFTALYRALR